MMGTCVAVNTFGWKRREIVSLLPQLAQEPVAKRAKLDSTQTLQDHTQIGLSIKAMTHCMQVQMYGYDRRQTCCTKEKHFIAWPVLPYLKLYATNGVVCYNTQGKGGLW